MKVFFCNGSDQPGDCDERSSLRQRLLLSVTASWYYAVHWLDYYDNSDGRVSSSKEIDRQLAWLLQKEREMMQTPGNGLGIRKNLRAAQSSIRSTQPVREGTAL